MITIIAPLLKGMWWLYYAAWKSGEWIMAYPGKWVPHLFRFMLMANTPVVLQMLVIPTERGTEHPVAGTVDLVQAIVAMANAITRAVLFVDKTTVVVIVSVVGVYAVHMLIGALKE